MRSQAVSFFVDCPTSKAKVVLTALTLIGAKMEKMKHKKDCLYISCGARLDLLNGVKNNCILNFDSDVTVFVVTQHAGGNQTSRSVATYAVVLTSPDHPLKNIPAAVETNKCRASWWEALRLRCVDANCPHLEPGHAAAAAPAAAAALAAAAAVQGFEDDGEKEADGETMDIDEDNSGAQGEDELGLLNANDAVKKTKAEAKVIFCSAKPLEYYRKVLTTILGLTSLSAGKVVVITRTAHPGLAVAAGLLGLEVILCAEDCPPHSKSHGEELMLKFWKQLKWKEAEAATVHKEVRNVSSSDLTFLTVLAPEKAAQVIQARSPPPETFCMAPYLGGMAGLAS
jgi:hypothetical protein